MRPPRSALVASASESQRNRRGVVDVGADEGEASGGGAGEVGGAGEPGGRASEEAAASSSDLAAATWYHRRTDTTGSVIDIGRLCARNFFWMATFRDR